MIQINDSTLITYFPHPCLTLLPGGVVQIGMITVLGSYELCNTLNAYNLANSQWILEIRVPFENWINQLSKYVRIFSVPITVFELWTFF